MSEEWKAKAGDRGAAVFICLQINNLKKKANL